MKLPDAVMLGSIALFYSLALGPLGSWVEPYLLPASLVMLAACCWSAWAHLHHRRRVRRRRDSGSCESCGYDLRGSTGACPEGNSVGG